MSRYPFVLAFALLSSSCAAAPPPPRPPAFSRPSWCERALASAPYPVTVLPRDVAPAGSGDAAALAARMIEESKVFAALGDHEALQNVAHVANDVSEAAGMLASRLIIDDLHDRASVEHALALTLRKRERAQLILRATCSEVAPTVAPSNELIERELAHVSTLQPAMRSCREQAPANDRPPRLRVLVELDPSGHVERATPVEDTFEPNRWGATDTAYCMVQRFEATQFPAPGARVTLLVEFVAPK